MDYLAQLIQRGDEKAFELLYEKTRRIVYSVCLSVLKNPTHAEEISQETYVTVWTHISEFKGRGLKTWVLTIAKNKALNALRKNRWERLTDFTEEESLAKSYTFDSEVETGILIRTALENLELVDRQIVLLKNSGMKTKDIAAFLELPRGTVSWKYSQALKKLKD